MSRCAQPTEGGGIAALRDEDGDGAADQVEYFGDHAGTGIAIQDGFLYASSDRAIFRYPLPEGEALVPQSGPETVVEGFPAQRSHASKAFTIDYVRQPLRQRRRAVQRLPGG